METKVNRVLMGFGLLAGLALGVGNPGGSIALAFAGAASAWLLRHGFLQRKGACQRP
ncbi:hypothetical protein GPA19_05830 [Azoarcus indigens]|uniref:Uncharacterized protein n=1 Tax=Azoarcus indigens TaxID=29545 RepID=A0A4R6DTC7_9RHOO|nr:hypothetical protein [Azoarcus indigens]NMG64467.1 hypothetical protein [Azoarcus indigens]TDN48405.1 hypothetical protein C7389_11571 [Azoarcus indigens]